MQVQHGVGLARINSKRAQGSPADARARAAPPQRWAAQHPSRRAPRARAPRARPACAAAAHARCALRGGQARDHGPGAGGGGRGAVTAGARGVVRGRKQAAVAAGPALGAADLFFRPACARRAAPLGAPRARRLTRTRGAERAAARAVPPCPAPRQPLPPARSALSCRPGPATAVQRVRGARFGFGFGRRGLRTKASAPAGE